MSRLNFRKPDFEIKPAFGGLFAAAAGLTTGLVSATGEVINQTTVRAGRKFEGVLFSLPVQIAQLDSGQSLTVNLTVQHSSASGSGFTTLAGPVATVLANLTTATGVRTVGAAKIAASFIGAKKFIRVKATRKGSAADTAGDIAASAFDALFVGPNESPA